MPSRLQNVRLPAGRHRLRATPIDTPGHAADFHSVCVRWSVCEGAVLLVDAAQGIEAQTLANSTGVDRDPHIIP